MYMYNDEYLCNPRNSYFISIFHNKTIFKKIVLLILLDIQLVFVCNGRKCFLREYCIAGNFAVCKFLWFFMIAKINYNTIYLHIGEKQYRMSVPVGLLNIAGSLHHTSQYHFSVATLAQRAIQGVGLKLGGQLLVR